MSKDTPKKYSKSIRGKLLNVAKSEDIFYQVIRTFSNRHTAYDENTMFFRSEYAENKQMQVRWQAFIKKITIKTNLTFGQTVGYIQDQLKPYWVALSNEQ